ncbi:AbrB/MazE/SpoVT family DNA-binding domain-containing protein [Infirmifilum sp. NZ]|uniref:AbrB/MazE/SpoVT family DNA-binding domain-containing protein n=1 Tax=Infirmifilum sp. NZ TaxID=2926850 RepID=UPI0027A19E9D|nr:AbrB/MazE/SpoVT family DNA-binding domain-containing protein [Infirmifilum sp. NZ]UNQ73591.1 AbrB/MazE/SpoVT family DNA-binding domain-containing protein [Infirmifilum sp. NZ]
MIGLTAVGKVGRKFALYLPKSVVKALGIREGDKVLIAVEGNSIVVRVVKDPIELALHGEKFASITPEDVERISLEWQKKYEDSP